MLSKETSEVLVIDATQSYVISQVVPAVDLGLLDLRLGCSLFGGIISNMKSLSNMIPFDLVLKIKFDWDFILKMMPQKKVSISGE